MPFISKTEYEKVHNILYISCCGGFPNLIYKIPYRRARAWPSRVRCASKGILHTIPNHELRKVFSIAFWHFNDHPALNYI